LEHLHVPGLACPVEIVRGDWQKDEDTRQALLNHAREEGFDWMIVQDADEFYTDEGWERLLGTLKTTDKEGIKTSWYTFWKSSRYVLGHQNGSLKDQNEAAAVRCDSAVQFVRSRTTNLVGTFPIVDAPCYHYGYVRTDVEMLAKVTSWGHAHQFDGPRWHRLKWMGWNERSVHLHPVRFGEWYRAVPFPLPQPTFAEHFDLAFTISDHRSLNTWLEETLWDRTLQAKATYRKLRGLF
jgi:hypothetical protein